MSLWTDELAKNFWLKQFPLLVEKFAVQAEQESEKTDDLQKKVEIYRVEYLDEIDRLMQK